MHGLDFALCQTGRARGRFDVTVTRAALDLRGQLRAAPPVAGTVEGGELASPQEAGARPKAH